MPIPPPPGSTELITPATYRRHGSRRRSRVADVADSHSTRTVHGRTLINRAAQVELTRMSSQRLSDLYTARVVNGHPAPVERVGQIPYWDKAEWLAWFADYQTHKLQRLTTVEQTGDPDELVNAGAAARILGYSSPQVISRYLTQRPGYFPDPDHTQTTASGRTKRWWRRRTIWEFAKSRDMRGGGRPPAT